MYEDTPDADNPGMVYVRVTMDGSALLDVVNQELLGDDGVAVSVIPGSVNVTTSGQSSLEPDKLVTNDKVSVMTSVCIDEALWEATE